MPLVTVVLPTYNRPKLLNRTLLTISRQTFKDFETIVVNDCGQDVSNVVAHYPFANYVEREINGGLSAARNTGIGFAEGKYIAYMDDDDIWFPEHLEVLVEHLETIPNAKAAYTDCYRWFNENYLLTGTDKATKLGEKKRNVAAIICLMHELECLDKVGLFDEQLRCMEDWDFLFRFVEYYPLLHIRQYTAAYSKRGAPDQLTTHIDEMEAAYDFIEKRHGRSPRRSKMELPV